MFLDVAQVIELQLQIADGLPLRPGILHGSARLLIRQRQKCQTKLLELTDEQAHKPVEYPWSQGRPISYLELQIYNLRHVQEHAAQLSLFLGQHTIPDEALVWVPFGSADEGNE